MPQTEPARPAFDEAIDLDDIGPRIAEPLPFHAANDDQQSIGRILRALQDRPARTSYLVAAMFSAAWVVGCLALSWAYLADFNAALGPGHSPAAAMIGLGAAALLPIIFFFGIAHMAWRSQELRLITQSMAQVAMRLAEPESVARDSIVTVGQAIRREVAAMGDGVERALARAGELETLVQNEVAALERTYSDNEVRIRGLLQDLANQRDTLVGQAEQVRSAINNVHIDLTQDLSTISDLVGQQVNEAAERITNRSTFGQLLSSRQAVQFMMAECATQLYISRLMLLHIAYKAEHGMDLRQENSMAKVYLAHMVHKVVDTAIQLHGALGYSRDTPLAGWYTGIRSQRLVDGPDEVHQWTVGRNVIKAYQEHGTTASMAGGDLL